MEEKENATAAVAFSKMEEKENATAARDLMRSSIGSKNGFFCLAKMGQKTLWVSAF